MALSKLGLFCQIFGNAVTNLKQYRLVYECTWRKVQITHTNSRPDMHLNLQITYSESNTSALTSMDALWGASGGDVVSWKAECGVSLALSTSES
jgi:hypothetical protein